MGYDVVILGAGVIGLSTALELHRRGLKPAIVARDLPEDVHSVGFASPWAGCNWFSFAPSASTLMAEVDTFTFKAFGQLAKTNPELCERIPFEVVWDDDIPMSQGGGVPFYKDLVGDYKPWPRTERLPGSRSYGHTFSSYTLNAPAYLAHLSSRCRALSIPILRYRLSSLDEAYRLPEVGQVELVVNATGLGARWLIGVEDEEVYPAKGQTILVKAPEGWRKRCVMVNEGFKPVAGDDVTSPRPVYIIPRPSAPSPSASSPSRTHVILGGTYIETHSTLPDMAEAERILKETFKLAPDLSSTGDWRGIEIISHNAGLRPARRSGIRLELERRVLGGGRFGGLVPGEKNAPSATGDQKKEKEKEVGVVHAYGLGSGGYQGSLGVANKVGEIAKKYLAEKKGAKAKL